LKIHVSWEVMGVSLSEQ